MITSSEVLAKRDAKELKEIYELFELSCSTNCEENEKETFEEDLKRKK
jgi:preprotein translocase subunit SecA